MASTAAVALAAANPAHAGDLFGPEYAGMVGNVTLFIGVGIATAFIGLIVTLPLIGHATWHAYKDLVPEEEETA